MIKFLNTNMYIYITQLDLHVDATVLLARDHPALGNRDLQLAFYGERCLTDLSCRVFEPPHACIPSTDVPGYI